MAKSNEQKERGGLVFEMENLALHARRIRYEVLAGIFNEQQIAFSEVEFSRYCLGRPDDYLPALLEKVGYTSAPATMVAERLRGETLSRLMQKTATIDATLKLWLDEAKKRGMPIAAVTSLPQEAADSVAASQREQHAAQDLVAFEVVVESLYELDGRDVLLLEDELLDGGE